MGTVFVVGSINQDHVLVVDRRPRAGETVTGATLVTRHGGKGANQAAAAAACGVTVTLLGRVGADPAGDAQRRDLARRGVDVSLVAEVTGVATGAAFITVTPDGQNSVVVAPGANGFLAASAVEGAVRRIRDSSVLVAQLEIPLETVEKAVAVCGRQTHVLLNAAPFRALPGLLLERVDTLVVNESEAAALVGSPVVGITGARAGAAALVARGPRTVIVTVGADGAVVADADTCSHVPAPPVPVVDTTGAGDVFVGTLAALVADGQPVHDAIVIAVARASASVAFVGARPAMT